KIGHCGFRLHVVLHGQVEISRQIEASQLIITSRRQRSGGLLQRGSGDRQLVFQSQQEIILIQHWRFSLGGSRRIKLQAELIQSAVGNTTGLLVKGQGKVQLTVAQLRNVCRGSALRLVKLQVVK